jgi:hypothetical protein
VSAGDLNQRVALGSQISEINSLGQAFNHMTASLRQADQAKTAFVADVTHELRTPLTVIKGTIETLEDGALDDLEGRGPLLQSMQRETDRLIRLVNDLLVLTRADAGALNLEIQPAGPGSAGARPLRPPGPAGSPPAGAVSGDRPAGCLGVGRCRPPDRRCWITCSTTPSATARRAQRSA